MQQCLTGGLDDFPQRLRICAGKVGGVRALSRVSGVSEAMIYRYLSRQCDITRGALLALARAAVVSAGWLLSGENVNAA